MSFAIRDLVRFAPLFGCVYLSEIAGAPVSASFCEIASSPRPFEHKEVSFVATVEGFPKFAMALRDQGCAQDGLIPLIVPIEMEDDATFAKLRSVLFPRYEKDLDDIGARARVRVTGEIIQERHRDVVSTNLRLQKVEILPDIGSND